MYLYLYCPVCLHSCTGAVPVLVQRACVVGDRASPTLPYTIVAFPFSVPVFLRLFRGGRVWCWVTWHCVAWWYSLSASLVYITGSRKRSQGNCRSYGLKPSKPSGHYTYHQFNIHQFTFCRHIVFIYFVWIWEQTAIIFLYSINRIAFITETECVYCAVWVKYVYS